MWRALVLLGTAVAMVGCGPSEDARRAHGLKMEYGQLSVGRNSAQLGVSVRNTGYGRAVTVVLECAFLNAAGETVRVDTVRIAAIEDGQVGRGSAMGLGRNIDSAECRLIQAY